MRSFSTPFHNYLLAGTVCAAFAILSGLRVSVSVALASDDIPSVVKRWTHDDLGLVGSCYFYGYGATQILGGILAHKFSPVRIFGVAVLLTSLLHLLIPLALDLLDPWAVITARLVQGALEGVLIPCNLGIWSRYAEQDRQSGLFSLTMTGISTGYIVAFPVVGLLINYCGWKSSLYFYGGLGVAWYGLFLILDCTVYNRSSSSSNSEKKEEEEEKNEGQGPSSTLASVPWLKFLMWRPIWAIAVMFVANDWTISLMFSDQPQYFRDVLKMDVVLGSVLGSIPYIVWSFFLALSGFLADRLIRRRVTSILNVRKLFTLGYILSALFFVGLSFTTDPNFAVAFLSMGFGISGISGAGYTMNIVDLSPQYASIIMGLCNTIGSFAGGLAPYTVQVLTATTMTTKATTTATTANVAVVAVVEEGETKEVGWKMVMLLTAGIQVVSVLVYVMLADTRPMKGTIEHDIAAKEKALDDDLPTLPHFINQQQKKKRSLTRRVSSHGTMTASAAATTTTSGAGPLVSNSNNSSRRTETYTCIAPPALQHQDTHGSII